MRKDVLGETISKQDPSGKLPVRTLTWFVTKVLRRSHTSINVLQVALAYLAGAKAEIHNQLGIATDCQAELAVQIAGIPQHVRDQLPGMDWLKSEFTPLPLIDLCRTFLASFVLASKFLLDKAFLNKAWAKLSSLEALEVRKCKHALGTALNWRLWVGREASRKCVAPAPVQPTYPSPANLMLSISPPTILAHAGLAVWENPTLSGPCNTVSPARSTSPILTIFTQGSTPLLTLYTNSKPGSEANAPQGYGKLSQQTHTPPYLTVTTTST